MYSYLFVLLFPATCHHSAQGGPPPASVWRNGLNPLLPSGAGAASHLSLNGAAVAPGHDNIAWWVVRHFVSAAGS